MVLLRRPMSKKILLVDDEVELCDLMAFQLRDEGYEVTQAYGMNEATELFTQADPDVVLSDMQMPGGSGLDLVIHLKEN